MGGAGGAPVFGTTDGTVSAAAAGAASPCSDGLDASLDVFGEKVEPAPVCSSGFHTSLEAVGGATSAGGSWATPPSIVEGANTSLPGRGIFWNLFSTGAATWS